MGMMNGSVVWLVEALIANGALLRVERDRNMPNTPKTLIYCFGMAEDFGGKPWGLSHYVCVRSAIERIEPDAVLFFYEYEPSGPWWNLTRELVTPVKIEAPRKIFGNSVDHPAHRADIVRLEKLIEMGGIYLDADVFVHRSFDDLLHYSTVLGFEGRGFQPGTANAVIVAEKRAPFLRRWYDTYRTFRGTARTHWAEHSVQIPSALASAYPAEVNILSYRAFFWPLWTAAHIELTFNRTTNVVSGETYATHLWEGKSWRYLHALSPGDVRRHDTNFHRWARPYLDRLDDDFGLNGERVNWESRVPGRLELLSERPFNALQIVRARLAARRLVGKVQAGFAQAGIVEM